MNLRFFPLLADALRQYMEQDEARALVKMTGVPWPDGASEAHFVNGILSNLEHGNNRSLASALAEALLLRAEAAATRTQFVRREYHERMTAALIEFKAAIETEGVPEQVSVSGGKPFEAKSEARAFLSQAGTEVLVVDNYIGAGTLDCLLDVKHSIRLLTGSRPECVSSDFVRALADFRAEGRQVAVKRQPSLHDRYIAFNDRLWVIGSSLKDAGRKSLNIVEIHDAKTDRLRELEDMWAKGLAI